MIETTHRNELLFRFPEVHEHASTRISFIRTLRIPDDNRQYPLPAGLGHFPLHHVDDFAATVPPQWREHGGVFLPMYQSEALWLSFDAGYPCAIKIAAGKINAVSGETWREPLSASPQDYVVVPSQPWLDGFSAGEGLIRQFVAMPLGKGFTAEEQLTGEAVHGGLQVLVYPLRAEHYEKPRPTPNYLRSSCEMLDLEMGLAPGGLMQQEIYEDRYGIDTWDQSSSSRCFVHIANSESYRAVTGCRPPTKPITAKQYKDYGIPWFDYYAADEKALKGARKLAGLDSVAARRIKQGSGGDEAQIDVANADVVRLGRQAVREGKF